METEIFMALLMKVFQHLLFISFSCRRLFPVAMQDNSCAQFSFILANIIYNSRFASKVKIGLDTICAPFLIHIFAIWF
jgi:hypothetical protein